MRRREFIGLVGGAAAAWPLATQAQQAERVRRIGVMGSLAPDDPDVLQRMAVFRAALAELGWAEGKNIQIDPRWAGGDLGHIRESAKALVRWSPDVVAAQSTPVTAALRDETDTIPIVFVQVADPIGNGFIVNLAKPGANLTGFTNFESSMAGKWLELLKDVSPAIARVGVLFNPDEGPGLAQYFLSSIEAAAASYGVVTVSLEARDPGEIERVIGAFGVVPNRGAVVLPTALNAVHREHIATLMARQRVPAVYGFRYFVTSGGLMSYGVETVAIWRHVAGYVDRILRGAKPAELPVQAPTNFELVINLNAAKKLGLTIPPSLLSRANEVIE
jgi:putative ABC transport system substrate-binding protein